MDTEPLKGHVTDEHLLTIAGIDPSKVTGVVVLREERRGRWACIYSAVHRVEHSRDYPLLAEAVVTALDLAWNDIALSRPGALLDAIALEAPCLGRPGARNPQSLIAQGRLMGMIEARVEQAFPESHIALVTPAESKKALTGNGKAHKSLMMAMAAAQVAALDLDSVSRVSDQEALADACGHVMAGAKKIREDALRCLGTAGSE